jgi:hypothetical protein
MQDLKALAEKLMDQLRDNPQLLENFRKDPAAAIQQALRIALPQEQAQQVADLVKTKLTADQLSAAADKLKGLFGK